MGVWTSYILVVSKQLIEVVADTKVEKTWHIPINTSHASLKCVYVGICKIPTGSGVIRKFGTTWHIPKKTFNASPKNVYEYIN